MEGKNVMFIFLSILMLPGGSMGECTCEPSAEGSNAGTLNFKIVALVSILAAGAVGMCLPMAGKIFPALGPEKDAFFIFKAFAAGVILSTGLIHVLPDAYEKLTSPCLGENPWGNFPLTGFIAMLAAMGTLMIDTYTTSYFTKRQLSKSLSDRSIHEETEVIDGHVHGQAETLAHGHVQADQGEDQDQNQDRLLRDRVISQVLELGIVVHSVLIGIPLGTSGSLDTIKSLMAAIIFHQFFEGIGLGGCISQAEFKSRAVVIMAIFFSMTTPVGIAIGIGVSTSYKENSQTSLIVEGVMNAASSGILIYMSLVGLLAADFMSPTMQRNGKLLFWSNMSLLFGAGCMSLLAIWA